MPTAGALRGAGAPAQVPPWRARGVALDGALAREAYPCQASWPPARRTKANRDIRWPMKPCGSSLSYGRSE